MNGQSIIHKSGQWWKAHLSFWSMMAGGVSLFISVRLMSGPSDAGSDAMYVLALFLGSLALIFGAIVFACVSIRCPACRAPWVWLGVNGKSHRSWLTWLLSQPACPVCGSVSERKAT